MFSVCVWVCNLPHWIVSGISMARRLLYLSSVDGGADQLADRYPNSSQNFTMPFWAALTHIHRHSAFNAAASCLLKSKSTFWKWVLVEVNTFELVPRCSCECMWTLESNWRGRVTQQKAMTVGLSKLFTKCGLSEQVQNVRDAWYIFV